MDIWATISQVITTVSTVVVLGLPAWRVYRKFSKDWTTFMRDWKGEEARPGHDAESGVMERLNNLDGQFKNNGGGSLKDAVDRIEKKLDQIEDRLEEGNARFDKIERQIEHG